MTTSPIMIVHISAGTLAVLFGAVALLSRKGARVHRLAGNVFFVSMLIMSACGAYVAFVMPWMISVLVGVFAFYLVATSWVTIKRKDRRIGGFEYGALAIAVALGITGAVTGLEALNSDTGLKDGLPAFPYLFFGGLALLAAAGDLRVILRRGIAGRQRIARHLWRMCFAYFIAAGSLFTGPGAAAFPEAIRQTGVLEAPEPIIIVLMLFWLGRVLFTNWHTKATMR